jgi:uncharacterized protein with FMN-binding domain
VRNVAVAAGTGGLLALLFSHPTSTNAKPRQDALQAGGSTGPAGATVVTGPVTPTGDYGPVQVRAWLRDGRVVKSEGILYPHTKFGGNFVDDILSAMALPELAASSVAHGDGNVDTVSTVTYTSEAYRTSLQAAVDAANNAGAG